MKSVKITLVATIVAIGIMCGGVMGLLQIKDKVAITEEVLAGDAKVMEGMALHLESEMGEEHRWNMEVPIGNADETQVNYQYEQQEEYIESESAFNLYLSQVSSITIYNGAYSWEDIDCGESAPKLAILDVASRAPIGSYYTETVSYSDYYEYYPIDYYISIDDDKCPSMKAREEINAYFQFPVVEGDELEITVYIDGEGGCEIECHKPEDSTAVELETCYVILEDGIYFATQMKQYGAEERYISKTDIYYMPLLVTEEQEFDIGEIEHITTLEENTHIQGLEDGGEVLIAIVNENEETYLSVYSKEDFTKLQYISMPSIDNGYPVFMSENTIVVLGEEDKFSVLTLEDEVYSIVLEGQLETPVIEDTMYCYTREFMYLDDKLIQILGYTNENNVFDDVMVCCYDETGILYAGRYHSSQLDYVFIMEECSNYVYQQDNVWVSFEGE